MSHARKLERMTPDEFFVWQEEQDMLYELVDGFPVPTIKAMTGASHRHDVITVNILISLGTKLRGKPCRPHTDAIAIRNPNGHVRRPDILVDCLSKPDSSMWGYDPRLLIEVLSPSTTRFDRFQKVEEYKQHPQVRVVLLIHSEEPQVIVWRRSEGADEWSSTIVEGLDKAIPLPEIDVTLTMAEIYEDVGLGPEIFQSQP